MIQKKGIKIKYFFNLSFLLIYIPKHCIPVQKIIYGLHRCTSFFSTLLIKIDKVPSPLMHTDHILLSRIAMGEEDAFTELFERYREKLFYYLLRHTKSPEVAEEIVTDIFMKLWLGRELAGQIKDIGAFLHKVGYYKVMDFLRTTARHERLKKVYSHHVKAGADEFPADPMLDDELKSLIYKAVNQLPPRRKLMYRLSRQEGMTHEQIACLLNLSTSTVNNTLVSASRSIVSYVRTYSKQGSALGLLLVL